MDVAFGGRSQIEILGAQADAVAGFAEAESYEGGALHRGLKPGALIGGGVEVEKNHNHLIFVAGEFANLQGTGVGGGFPIDVARAFENFVRTDTVEVVTGAATPGFDLAGYGIRERLETWARIEAGINDDVVAQGDDFAALSETEGEAGGELKGALTVTAASRERSSMGSSTVTPPGITGKKRAPS